MALGRGDVVCWVLSHPSIPRIDTPVFFVDMSRLLTMVKFLRMQARGTAGASR